MTSVLYDRLFDDAAMFPPGDAPLPEAVRGHLERRSSWFAQMLGPLVCAANRLGELGAVASEPVASEPVASEPVASEPVASEPVASEPVAVSVVGPWNSPEVEALFTGEPAWLGPRFGVVALEVAVGPGEGAAERVSEIAKRFSDSDGRLSLFVEVPPGPERLAVLDILADAASRVTNLVAAKLRTGGLAPETFPSEADVADWIVACAERALRFKCTAGLHSVVRHRDEATGFEHHGFGNMLLATAASLAGGSASDLLAIVGEQSEEAVARALGDGGMRLAEARERFLSFGTCSVTEPVEDLVRLGLLVGE